MHKLYEYWDNRSKWFVYWYFVLEIIFIIMDPSLFIGITFYFIAVPLICESTRINFDYSRTYLVDMSSVKKLLPIKKNSLNKYYLIFPLILTVITLLLLLSSQVINNYYNSFYLDIYLCALLFLGIYICLLIYDYCKKKSTYLFQKTKEAFYFTAVCSFVFTGLIFNLTSDGYVSIYGDIHSRLWIIIIAFFAMFFITALSAKDNGNIIKERESKQKIDKSFKSIARLSHYTYAKGNFEVVPFATIGTITMQLIINNSFSLLENAVNSSLMIIVIIISVMVLAVSLNYSFNHHFAGITYLKLIPCSKKKLFYSAIYCGIKNYLALMVTVFVILFIFIYFRNINFSIFSVLKMGYLVELILLSYITIYIVIVGFSKNDQTFYIIMGIFLVVLLMVIIGYYFKAFNQYWYVFAIGVGLFILMTYKRIFTSYLNFAKQN
ncbi:MAG: hypothetical protein RR443_02755 [Anaerorhabdus sp.]|uniref:hypothetical protein n=1 Tax=Anaerorhabdus sp. TaxID=1872524 RepID=UPI002FC848D3